MLLRYSIVLATAAVLLLGTGCAAFIPGLLPATPSPVALPSPIPSTTSVPTTAPSAPLGTPGTPTLGPGSSSSPNPAAATATPLPQAAAPTATTLSQAQTATSAPRRISFPAGGTTATVQGITATPGMDRFVLRALGGQTMTANISSTQGPVILIIYAADGNVLISDHAGASSWTGLLPTTQDYIIDTRSVADAKVAFALQVTIPPLGAGAPTPARIRISFPPGGTSAAVQGITATSGMDGFVVRALGGQTMTANISSTQGPVIVIIYGADGNVLISDHAGASTWTGTLPTTQDYIIDTRSVGDAKVPFALQVTIPPLGSEAPTPTPKRISFPPGSTSTTVQNTLPVNQIDRWVLRALAGQTMTVNTSTTAGQVILIIWGVDGTVLISDHAGATSWSGQLPTTEDYYIDVRSVGTTAAFYSLQVTIPPP